MVTAIASDLSICRTHNLVNNLFCFNDNKPICTDCVPLHLDHNVTYITNRKFAGDNPGYIKKSPPPTSNLTYQLSPRLALAPANRISPNTKSPRLATIDVPPASPPSRLIENPVKVPSPTYYEITEQMIRKDNTVTALNNIPINNSRILSSYPAKISELPIVRRDSPRNSQDILGNSIRTEPNYIKRSSSIIGSSPITTVPVIIDNPKIINNTSSFSQASPIVLKPSPIYQTQVEQTRSLPNDIFILFKLDNDSSNIYIFDKDRLSGSRIQIKNGIVAPESAMILCQNQILLCGGSDGASNQTASSYLIDIQNNSSATLANMQIPKKSHTLGKVIDSEVYSVGGYNSSQLYLNTVEKYSINSGNWSIMPQINLPRQDVSLCGFNAQYLYCFGGSHIEGGNWVFTNIIERFNTIYEPEGWKGFQLSRNEVWTHIVYIGAKQLSQTEIVIFGGYDGNYLDDVLILNVVENKISKTGVKLRRPSSFIQRNITIVDIDRWIYAPGFPKLDIHRYSIAGNVFEYLDEANYFSKII